MKKKFGLFALVLAVLLCGSLFLLAACDETEEDPADTPATISVTVNGTAQTSGGTYSATVGTAYTFAATASNGNAVTISYVFGDAAAEELNGTSFTPETAGSYAFTFAAEGATSFTLTLVATEAEVPPATQYTVTYALGDHAAADAPTPTEQTAAANATITLAGAAEAAEGYTFGGWSDGTTTYEAGAEYTVTGNVTMTAVWNVVHTHTYTWEVTAYPVESDGAATGTCSGCAEGTEGHTKTVPLPKVIGVDEPNSNLIEGTVPESGAQVGKYYVTVTNPTCTADAGMAFSYVYDAETVIPFTYTVEGTALGHAYVVEYDSATMTSAGWTATATCDRSGCGATHEFTNVPAVDSKDTDNWSETSKIDYEGQMPTCTTDGKTALAYKNAAPDGGVLIVKNVPIPALGHAYEISYEDGSVKADCLKCDSVYSATVTISDGGATGETVLTEENFVFNAETQQFTVTLPENEFEKDGFTFSGWLVGGETYTAGQTVTVAAGNTLEITAQWTAVNVPLISLVVKVDGQHPIETPDGGNMPACVGTKIHYAASVPEGQVTVSYTLNGGDVQSLSAEGEFTFAEAGTYIFVITAPGADDYTFTVNVMEHSLTFTEAQEATCTADGHSAYAHCSTCQKYFAVTEGSTVSNFTITGDPLNDTTSFVIAATGHSGTYAYNAEKQAVVFTCGECSTTIDCEITGLTVTGDAASAYDVDNGDGTYTAYGFTVEAVYTSVDDNPVTEITIPLDDENLTVSVSGGYKAATVTFTYAKTVGSVSGTTLDAEYAVYEQIVNTGSVTNAAMGDRLVPLGTYTGEFELRYSLSNIVRTGSDTANGGCSWVLTFDSGTNQALILREDNWIGTNFGRTDGQITNEGSTLAQAEGASITFSGFTTTNNAFWTELNDFTNPLFVITRSYSEGVYTLSITISEGEKSVTISIVEPTTNGNIMTVSLGSLNYGENGNPSYDYSAVLCTEKGLTESSLTPSATAVTVSGGTDLVTALNGITVEVSYAESTLKDTVSVTTCNPTCAGYNANPDELTVYTVTLTYGDAQTTVSVTVDPTHVHTFVSGVCSSCGYVCQHTNMDGDTCSDCGATWTTTNVNRTYDSPTVWQTWYEVPVALTRGNSKVVVTGTQETTLTSNWLTVLWESHQGFTGRLDNYGWLFDTDQEDGENDMDTAFGAYISTASVTTSDNTYYVETTEESEFWALYQQIAPECSFEITFEWSTADALTVTVVLTSDSNGTYTCVYTLPIVDSSITEYTFHLTAEGVSTFTVTDYSNYVWNS